LDAKKTLALAVVSIGSLAAFYSTSGFLSIDERSALFVLTVAARLMAVIGDFLTLTGDRSGLSTIAIVAIFGLGISIVASKTASAGIFRPIAIGLGASTGVGPVVVVDITTSLIDRLVLPELSDFLAGFPDTLHSLIKKKNTHSPHR